MSAAVPEFWETSPPERCVARPFGWLLVPVAVFGLVLFPKHVGARLAQSSMTKALFAHGFVLVLLLAALALASEWDLATKLLASTSFGQLTFSEQLRLPAVVCVELLMEASEGSGGAWLVLGGLAGAHGAAWLAAWLLLPFISIGERPRRAYWRSVKLVLWSTPTLLVLAAALVWHAWADERGLVDADEELVVPAIVFVWLACWFRTVVRMGARYAGPPEGFAWEPRPARCVDCGYMLTSLPLDGRCPECGLEVVRSLPGARALPRWAQAGGRLARIPAYFRTAWTVVRRPEAFRTMKLYEGRDAALAFAGRTCLLFGVVVAGPLVLGGHWDDAYANWLELVCTFALLTLAPAALIMLGLLGLALLACRFGWRDPRRVTTLTCYAAALFLPTALLIPVMVLGGVAIDASRVADYLADRLGLTPSWYEAFVALMLAVPPFVALAWALSRYRYILRTTRHASA